ncbi:hypothetical protein BDY21DRAFT_362401 [Lineolata rhizophorae]|uniref:Uncharacterized protein n=1 Tax=Lineolata rhizophorae TaxID=578093 RepID=A0A6A6P4E4_9PEZI|nr:hypothetical protein BDY21DRAFT_362401 [Lineolata rhizophorae]
MAATRCNSRYTTINKLLSAIENRSRMSSTTHQRPEMGRRSLAKRVAALAALKAHYKSLLNVDNLSQEEISAMGLDAGIAATEELLVPGGDAHTALLATHGVAVIDFGARHRNITASQLAKKMIRWIDGVMGASGKKRAWGEGKRRMDESWGSDHKKRHRLMDEGN